MSSAPTRSKTIFDQAHYLKLIETRGETIRRVVSALKPVVELRTGLDAGCGAGFFAQTLRECGLEVRGFDGRQENVQEATERYPGIAFAQGDVEDQRIRDFGTFDLVLCFGLLYHLENPFAAIRNLRSLTGKVLLLESMCVPDEKPWMVLREELRLEDQSLTELAFYASEGCLTKMLYRAGFRWVGRLETLPDHDDFRQTAAHLRRRTVLVASESPIRVSGVTTLSEPQAWPDPWVLSEAPRKLFFRLAQFMARPAHEKLEVAKFKWRLLFPPKTHSISLPFGAKWLHAGSSLDHVLRLGQFENPESAFVSRFLRKGMVVFDLGAHHGFYTLLASKLVGAGGKVIAFEPSPRERKRLRTHIRLNGCANVRIEAAAVADRSGKADLFLVDGQDDWCNSLKPPVVEAQTRKVAVKTLTLDEYLSRSGIAKVDFIKLDVEGAELNVLKGASKLINGARKPVMMIEAYDIRSRPWGYEAREIVEFLAKANYKWFEIGDDGTPSPVEPTRSTYDANLIAVPAEDVDNFLCRLTQGDD